MNKQNILNEIKNEINQTLFFFVEGDLEIYGHITEETVKAFKTQNVAFPESLKKFTKELHADLYSFDVTSIKPTTPANLIIRRSSRKLQKEGFKTFPYNLSFLAKNQATIEGNKQDEYSFQNMNHLKLFLNDNQLRIVSVKRV